MIREQHKSALPYLRGAGLEIGALHEPFAVPAGVKMTYVDTLTVEQATALFPEIDAAKITKADRILDLDREGLSAFPDESFDFVIISHVLEHLANPLKAVGEVFRVVRIGGHAVVAIPDMRFTFDKNRALTPFAHLFEDFKNQVTESSDEHYLDFLRGVAPEVLTGPPESVAHHVARVRGRREHAHVWNSETFREFLSWAGPLCGYAAKPVFESNGDQNGFEYFSVWQREA